MIRIVNRKIERLKISKKYMKLMYCFHKTFGEKYLGDLGFDFKGKPSRIEIVKKALFSDLKLNKKKIIIISFTSLTTDLCKKYKANIILRGLRAVSDFEYEFQLAGMNRKLNSNIETIFLMSDVENQIISSKFVKEIIKLKGDIKKFTTKSTIKLLKKKYE